MLILMLILMLGLWLWHNNNRLVRWLFKHDGWPVRPVARVPVKVSEIEAVVVAEHHLLAQNLRAILARRLALFNTVELEGRRAGIGRGRARIGRVGHGALARSPREAGLGLRRRRWLECDQRDHIGHVGGRGHVAVPVGHRWVIAILKNQLPTTLPIASILSSWHYQLK